jgi:hypothetical protein
MSLVNRKLRQGSAYLSYRGLPAATWFTLQKRYGNSIGAMGTVGCSSSLRLALSLG